MARWAMCTGKDNVGWGVASDNCICIVDTCTRSVCYRSNWSFGSKEGQTLIVAGLLAVCYDERFAMALCILEFVGFIGTKEEKKEHCPG